MLMLVGGKVRIGVLWEWSFEMHGLGVLRCAGWKWRPLVFLWRRLLVIREGCALARLRNFNWIYVESDSKPVISSLVAGMECVPWEVLPILSHALELGRSFQGCTWCWVPRSANAEADFVASHLVAGMWNSIWVARPPFSLVGILNKDGLPYTPPPPRWSQVAGKVWVSTIGRSPATSCISLSFLLSHYPNRFRFTRETTFGRRHMNSSSETSFHLWMRCFFRQFYNSVAKVDYITIRHGFIAAHLPSRKSFDFQKYIQRSLEEDFKIMVAISPLMWFGVAIFMLVDVYGWHVYLWLSYVPLLAILVLGAKLEYIVAKMALQIKEQNSVIVGTPLVRVNDDLFWFRKPRFVLLLIHYTLFLNAFEFAFFIWVTIQFGFKSCYHEHTAIIVTRISLAVTTQVLCSYITLPLYALVTQMGSQFRGKIMEDNMAGILKQWHAEVRNRRKKQQQLPQSARTSFSAGWSSVRNSFSEMPSCIRKVSKPDEPAESSVQLSNRGNVQDEIVELDGSSRGYGRNGDYGT